MDEGTTNVGTITATLRINKSEWNAELDQAEAKAAKLSTVDPTIKVTTKADEALAKLAAVDTATRKLGIATESTRLAYLRLDQVQSKEGDNALQVAAAHLAASRAEETERNATARLAAAKAALAAVEEEEAVATGKANDANKTNVTRMGLIVAAVAVLVPLLASLVGYSAAVAGSLGLMGAAGVLAIVGIKQAMQEGNKTGSEYAAGLGLLKGDLNALAATSANAMLGSFDAAVSKINADMPFLNTQVGLFSRQLGTTGNLALTGVLNLLKVLNPLFLTAGVYVQQLALGFAKWTQGSGIQQFASYALAMLPKVADTLGALATMALHLIQATAPLGTVLLGALTGISQVISSLPLPVLGALIGAITAGTIAFKAWGFVAPMLAGIAEAMGAVGVATTIASGPIGWIAAGVAALAAILIVATSATQNQTQATQDYTAALQEDNGVIGQNVRQMAAKNLQDAGAITLGNKLGLSGATLVNALLKEGAARDLVKDKIKQANAVIDQQIKKYDAVPGSASMVITSLNRQKDANNDLLKTIDAGSGTLKQQITAYNQIADASGATTISTRSQLDAATALATQYGTNVATYVAVEGENAKAKEKLDETTLAMQLQNDAAGLLANGLKLLNKGSLTVAEAQTGLADANNGVLDSFKQNGKAVDGNSKAAVANQQAIQRQVEAAQNLAQAQADATGSSVAGTKAYTDSKAALEAQLKATGELTPALQTYIDKLYDIKDLKIPPTKIDIDAAKAQATLDLLLKTLGKIDPHNAGFGVTYQGTVVYSDARNQANTEKGHASGGTVTGPGTSTSDSVPMYWASAGEEVIRESSARQVRPFLKALNANPEQAIRQLQAAGSKSVTFPTTIITQADPRAAFADFQRQQNLLVQ